MKTETHIPLNDWVALLPLLVTNQTFRRAYFVLIRATAVCAISRFLLRCRRGADEVRAVDVAIEKMNKHQALLDEGVR